MTNLHCSTKSKSRTKKYTCLTKKNIVDILKTSQTPFKNTTKDNLYSILVNELKSKENSNWWKLLPQIVDKKLEFSMKYLLYKVKNGKNLKKWLSSEDLQKIIYQNITEPSNFYGCFSADHFNRNSIVIKKNTGMIFNTSKASEKGRHWVAIYFDDNDILNYFDPLGYHPTGDILKFIKSTHLKINVNKIRYQYIDGTCGDFCCIYLIDNINSNINSKILNLKENSVNKLVRTKLMFI